MIPPLFLLVNVFQGRSLALIQGLIELLTSPEWISMTVPTMKTPPSNRPYNIFGYPISTDTHPKKLLKSLQGSKYKAKLAPPTQPISSLKRTISFTPYYRIHYHLIKKMDVTPKLVLQGRSQEGAITLTTKGPKGQLELGEPDKDLFPSEEAIPDYLAYLEKRNPELVKAALKACNRFDDREIRDEAAYFIAKQYSKKFKIKFWDKTTFETVCRPKKEHITIYKLELIIVPRNNPLTHTIP